MGGFNSQSQDAATMCPSKGAEPLDRLSRPLRDLRLSITDRCNLRCTYCMPRDVFGPGYEFLPKEMLLSYEEMTRLVSAIAPLGLQKIRLTGGEPLLRRDVADMVGMLRAALGSSIDIAMTTNGLLLSGLAEQLAASGLNRVTVSIDALDENVYSEIVDSSASPLKVLNGIEAALQAGLEVKVNAVIKKAVNEDQIIPLVEYFRGTGIVIRFIEFMDVGNSNRWSMKEVVTGLQMRNMISEVYPLEAVERTRLGEVAQRWRFLDGAGEVGFITSVSQPFCGDCCRARISVDGRLFTCLFTSTGHDLKTAMRSGMDDDGLRNLVSRIWSNRDDRYSELRRESSSNTKKVEMSFIGG